MDELLKRAFSRKINDLLENKYGLVNGTNEHKVAKRKIATLRKKNGERFYGEYPDYWAWLATKDFQSSGVEINSKGSENMNILMKSNVYVVTEIKKPTTAYIFKNIESGDEVQMSIPIDRVGHSSRGRTYAPQITFKNLSKDEETTLSFNQLPNRLENFGLKERLK